MVDGLRDFGKREGGTRRGLRRAGRQAVAVLCLAVPINGGVAGPGAAGDGDQGRVLAKRLCAVCHMNTGQGEKTGPMSTPSFQAIAARPGQDHAQIVAWLRSRPVMMPDHNVTWDEADALAAFIMSLRNGEAGKPVVTK